MLDVQQHWGRGSGVVNRKSEYVVVCCAEHPERGGE